MNGLDAERETRYSWLQFALLALSLAFLYYKVGYGLVVDWINMPDFSHGFFIPVISLYLVWERRESLANAQASPADSGILLLLMGLGLLFLGNLAAENFTMRFSLPLVTAGMVLFLFGWNHLKILAFPILFLIFMIPLPSILLQKITFPMQLFASKVAVSTVNLFGIPVLREGNVIYLTETTLEVAEACSGIRSLMSLLALSTIYAYFMHKKNWVRIVLVLASFPIAIIVNALRVSATAVLAQYFGETVAQGFYHDFSGYILFIVSLLLLFLLGTFLSFMARRFG